MSIDVYTKSKVLEDLGLTDQQILVLHMLYIEEKNNTEISGRLGMSSDKVSQIQKQALRQIVQYFQFVIEDKIQ